MGWCFLFHSQSWCDTGLGMWLPVRNCLLWGCLIPSFASLCFFKEHVAIPFSARSLLSSAYSKDTKPSEFVDLIYHRQTDVKAVSREIDFIWKGFQRKKIFSNTYLWKHSSCAEILAFTRRDDQHSGGFFMTMASSFYGVSFLFLGPKPSLLAGIAHCPEKEKPSAC